MPPPQNLSRGGGGGGGGGGGIGSSIIIAAVVVVLLCNGLVAERYAADWGSRVQLWARVHGLQPADAGAANQVLPGGGERKNVL